MSSSRANIAVLLALFCAILCIRVVDTVPYGSRCTANGQCDGKYQYCKIVSPSCNVGTCLCQPGFVWRSSNLRCMRPVYFGQACNTTYDFCDFDNSFCNRTCQCASGFVRGPISGTCDLAASNKKYMERCFDSNACYYNLQCINNYCQCAAGQSVSTDGFQCFNNVLGDSCSSSDDCINIRYGICDKGECTCTPPWVRIWAQTSPRVNEYVCARNLVTEGQRCSIANATYCAPRFYCDACSPLLTNVTTCLSPNQAYTDLDATIISAANSREFGLHKAFIAQLALLFIFRRAIIDRT